MPKKYRSVGIATIAQLYARGTPKKKRRDQTAGDGLVNAQFVKFGEFSRDHLIWFDPHRGYFVTLPSGYGFNPGGPRLVPQRKIDEAYANAGK